MLIHGNTAVLNVHNIRNCSCHARIVSVILDLAVLYHSLCGLAPSITVPLPLPFLCSLFLWPSHRAGSVLVL